MESRTVFPEDIWRCIRPYVRVRDRAACCCVSRQLLRVFRPLDIFAAFTDARDFDDTVDAAMLGMAAPDSFVLIRLLDIVETREMSDCLRWAVWSLAFHRLVRAQLWASPGARLYIGPKSPRWATLRLEFRRAGVEFRLTRHIGNVACNQGIEVLVKEACARFADLDPRYYVHKPVPARVSSMDSASALAFAQEFGLSPGLVRAAASSLFCAQTGQVATSHLARLSASGPILAIDELARRLPLADPCNYRILHNALSCGDHRLIRVVRVTRDPGQFTMLQWEALRVATVSSPNPYCGCAMAELFTDLWRCS